ncbi:MAG: 23S rRNA (guanosine(2251)-2'-O)-methyltransferase RlmB [Pseudomonadota bacterium]|jgi:23S rRNA (guanosine2251-2'-O)-methyltransferase|nr:23S rRNA (guanosine(2251)-2'-O)-methyltransferase RlmB [Pseudomonadota bacterium]QKK05709.1 MAG: 23S rRNA (guanosine(2251)-2'-O)-methyltransferase RlmB [Pseudomonadota bacterium]
MQKKRPPGKRTSDKRGAKKHAPRPPAAAPQKIRSAGRDDWQKQALLFGVHAVREAVLNPQRRIQAIYVTEAGKKLLSPTLEKALKAGINRPDLQIIDKPVLDKMLPENAVHQGMAAQVQPLLVPDLEQFCAALPQDSSHIRDNIMVILDQVTDPHNIGAILRSAAAFGAKALIVQDRHTPEITGTLAKSASGAVEHVPILREVNLARSIALLQKHGILCTGFDERGAMTLAELTADKNLSSYAGIALVMGAEGDGMRRLTAESCDVLVRLPSKGAIQSLNVSNAAAVALYELVR